MEKTYFIKWEEGKVISIVEITPNTTIASTGNYIVETLENAQVALSALSIDITALEELKNLLNS